MKYSKALYLLPLMLLATLLFVQTGVVAQSSDPDRVFMIDSPNVEHFPEVTQIVRAIDQNNNAILSLVDSQIKVFENGQRIETHGVTPGERTPAFIVFVIDQGQYFNPGNRRDEIQQALRQWAEESHFREGFDTVAILSREVVDGRDQTVELLPPTQSPTAFLNEVNRLNLNNSSARTDGLAGVEDGLTLLRQLVRQTGAASTAVVYVGSIIENDSGQERAASEALAVASKAREQNTIVHTLDSDASHRFSEPMQNLADASGGIYLPISNDRSNDANVRGIYQNVIDQAQTHIVSYNSNYNAEMDNPGARNVAIVPINVPVDAVESVASYTVSPKPPTVGINAPRANDVIDRNPTSPNEDSYEVTTTEIEAEVDWSGNIAPREIVEAELVINGQTVSPEDSPEVVNNRLKIRWDLSGIVDERSTFRVQVRIRDSLGFEATSTAVQVTVDAQLPLVPTATPIINAPPPPPAGSTEDAPPPFPLYLLLIGAFIVLLLVGLLVFMIMRRNKSSANQNPAPATASNKQLKIEKTMVGGQALGQRALAKIEILIARRDIKGETINLYTNRTSFGRDPRQCDIQLYEENEKSSVSGLHCTIQYDRVQRKFFITDDNSSNGTYIDNERLKPNVPRELTDDTTIVLGSIGRRGAKIRFLTVATDTPPTPASKQPLGGEETIIDASDIKAESALGGAVTELGPEYTPSSGNRVEDDATIVDTPLPKPRYSSDESKTIPSTYNRSLRKKRNAGEEEDDSWLEEL